MRKNSGKQTKSVPTSFDLAPAVEEIAHKLIPKYHSHLVNSEIAYMFRSTEMKSGGKMVVAKAEKVSKQMRVLTNKDFIITVSAPVWVNLSDSQKEAVVDHELMHCFVDEDEKSGEKKNVMLHHDFADFNQVIIRHGMYMGDLELLEKAVEQVHSKEGKKVVLEKKTEADVKVEIKVESTPKEEIESKTEEVDEDDEDLFADEPPKVTEKPTASKHTYIPLMTKPVDPDDDDPLFAPDPPKEQEEHESAASTNEEESMEEFAASVAKPKRKQKRIIVRMESKAKSVKGFGDDNDMDFS